MHDVSEPDHLQPPARRPRAQPDGEAPHDILAAEEFVVGSADPALHVEPPHDVLAAEEFVVGTADPALHHEPFSVPDKPGAEPRPHDVLAADEFAVPAVAAGRAPAGEERTVVLALGPRGLVALGAAAVLVAAVLRRRR
jgi:hypothetical protein